MSGLVRLAHQVRYDLLVFRRNPASVFFTIMVPTAAYLIFGFLIDGGDAAPGFTAALLALAVVGATFVQLAMSMTFRRERGLLKRFKTAPVPAWVFVVSSSSVGLVVASAMAVLLSVIGAVLFDLSVSAAGVGLLVVTLLIGVGCFAAMGLGLSCFVPSEETAPSMVQGVALPLYLISGVFLPITLFPAWIQAIAEVFPVYHLVEAMRDSYEGLGVGAIYGHWLVLLAWGALATVFVTRRFRWMPNR